MNDQCLSKNTDSDKTSPICDEPNFIICIFIDVNAITAMTIERSPSFMSMYFI